MARIARLRRPAGRPGPRPAAAGVSPASRPMAGVALAVHGGYAYVNTSASRRRDAPPGQPGDRAAHQEPGAVECDGHGRAGEPSVGRDRRPHLDATRRPRRSTRSGSIISSGPGARTANGDQVYFQGHASPGIYARAFLEGRLSVEKLHNFRQELAEGGGLSSYPHPWLMPDFWQFPTVSMGLGPIMSIYQARFNRYLEDRGLQQAVATRKSGRSSAMARPTSRSPSVRSASRRARSSTT